MANVFSLKRNLLTRLLKGSLILLLGLLITNLANYLYQLAMGRLLGVSAYGELASLLSLLVIVSVPGTALLTMAMKFVSDWQANDLLGEAHTFMRSGRRYLGFLAILLIFFTLTLAQPVASFLKLQSLAPIYLLGPILSLILLVQFNRGAMQGLQKFGATSFSTALESTLKLGFGLLFVWLGLSVSGAFGAILASLLVVYLLSSLPLGPISKASEKRLSKKAIFNYSGPALLAALLIALATNADVIIIKHFFEPELAGLYGALSTIGKIPFYLSAPVAMVMFPMIVDLYERHERHFPLLVLTFLLTILIALPVLAVFVAAPFLIVGLLYGQAYVGAGQFLALFGLAQLLFALMNVFIQYFLAVGKNYHFLWPIGLSSLTMLSLLWFYHPDFMVVSRILVISFAIGLVLMVSYYLIEKRETILATLTRS